MHGGTETRAEWGVALLTVPAFASMPASWVWRASSQSGSTGHTHPGDRGIWVKSKCLNREEFVVVGWTDPEGSRQHIGALLLGYYTKDGRLHYAGRAGTGMNDRELERLAGTLSPLQAPKMALAAPPPRDNRFGSPLKLSKVHWVRPEAVVEVTYLTWTEGGLLRAVSYQGQREDKAARAKW